MTVETLQFVRRCVFVIIGLTCVGYAMMYLVLGLSAVSNPFLPGIVGLLGAATIWGACLVSGHSISEAVFDELSRQEWGQALKFGYWLAVGLYPVFGVLLWLGMVGSEQSFAVMGTLTGGMPLLYYSWLDGRG